MRARIRSCLPRARASPAGRAQRPPSRVTSEMPRTPARCSRVRTGPLAKYSSSGPMMPPWTSSGLTRRNCRALTPWLEDARQHLDDAGDVLQRRRRRGATPPSAISRNQIGGKCGRASASIGNRFDELPQLVAGGGVGCSDRAYTRGHGVKHVAEDVPVERGLAAEVVVDHRLVERARRGRCDRRWHRRSRGRRTRRRRPRTGGCGCPTRAVRPSGGGPLAVAAWLSAQASSN